MTVAEFKINGAGLKEGIGIADRLRPCGKRFFHFHRAHQPIAGITFLMYRQCAEQRIVVDGPKQPVCSEIGFIPERCRLQHDYFFHPFLPGGEGKTNQVLPGYPDVFMVIKLPLRSVGKRVNDEAVIEERGFLRQFLLSMEIVRKKIVQLAKPLIITGQSDVQLPRSVPEVNAQYRPDAVLFRQPDEIEACRRRIDIGKRQGFYPHVPCQFQQFPGRDGAVAEGVVCVTV